MTEHKDIQNPDDYTEEDYIVFEKKLFSLSTPTSELEDICMTLAHLPTKQAQDLLGKFKESTRANEVGWLDVAMDEGEFHYFSPENEQEERDYFALKVIQEIEDETIELQGKHDDLRLDLRRMDIEQEAVRELVGKGEVDKDETLAFHDCRLIVTSQMEDLERQISVKEKTIDQIKESIKTERYKNMDSMHMRHVHFC
ncbi:hypothetical protein QUF72_19510 [Desulfobacterales bacterium HSG2]|nr:hypothetical protein [Desulfobacterales bacterium HSG2]